MRRQTLPTALVVPPETPRKKPAASEASSEQTTYVDTASKRKLLIRSRNSVQPSVDGGRGDSFADCNETVFRLRSGGDGDQAGTARYAQMRTRELRSQQKKNEIVVCSNFIIKIGKFLLSIYWHSVKRDAFNKRFVLFLRFASLLPCLAAPLTCHTYMLTRSS